MSLDQYLVDGKVKAIGIRDFGDVSKLEDITIPLLTLQGRDIRVFIKAVALNPVDTSVRLGYFGRDIDEYRVLGYDGAGEVVEVGPEATLFKVGDKVMYAGNLIKSGTNSDLAIVDERLVGRAPRSLSFAEAAALPLTGLTAWEGLFEHLELKAFDPANRGKRILVVPGAGGVGSLVIQLAAKLLGLYVIATASRPESIEHCKKLGAHLVINHREPLKAQLDAAGIDGVEYIYNGVFLSVYTEQYAQVIKPFGKIVSILESIEPVTLRGLMMKRVTLTWELMFTRAFFNEDPIQQHYILENIAQLIDDGVLVTTVSSILPYNVENMRKAHEIMESGTAIGKVVLSKDN
eukprot:gene10315-11220_t